MWHDLIVAGPLTVDEYLAKIPPRDRAALQKLRATIKAASPGATEAISYQMPAFNAHGRSLVSYAAFSDHYSLFPMGVSVVNANLGKLAPHLSGKSTIRFSFDKPLPVSIVRLVVKARLAENAAAGPRLALLPRSWHGHSRVVSDRAVVQLWRRFRTDRLLQLSRDVRNRD